MAVKQRFDPPKQIRINTPKTPGVWGGGFYHGMNLQAIGIDTDDLVVVPLPAIAIGLPIWVDSNVNTSLHWNKMTTPTLLPGETGRPAL